MSTAYPATEARRIGQEERDISGANDFLDSAARPWRWRHDAGLDHGSEVVANCPVLHDATVAEPEALSVTEIDGAAAGLDRTTGTGHRARRPHPGDNPVTFGDEILDLYVQVW
jgi:hypothetical protein